VVTSGAFRQGFCCADCDALEPGLYTIVVCTFDAQQKVMKLLKPKARVQRGN
jgi:hypothetical protein